MDLSAVAQSSVDAAVLVPLLLRRWPSAHAAADIKALTTSIIKVSSPTLLGLFHA